ITYTADLHYRLSIRSARRRNHAVAIGEAARQFALQPLGLVVHPHPAQLANALDEIVRPTLVVRGVALWLLERHWHGYPPASFTCLVHRLRATPTSLRCGLGLPTDHAPLSRRDRASVAKRSALTYCLAGARE